MEATKTALELRQVAQRIYQALTTGDLSRIQRHTSSRYGRIVLGGRREQTWQAQYPEFLSTCSRELARLAGGSLLIRSDPEAHVQGELGWIRDEATVFCGDSAPTGLRLAALLRWEHGDWRLVELRLTLPHGRAAA